MKFRVKQASLTAGLLTLSGMTAAQQISTSLPLTSVGEKLMWAVGDQDLYLDVNTDGKVRLELYSPRLDPSDYRNETYYGDEEYTGGTDVDSIVTTFTLIDEEGNEVLSKEFTPGPHMWETLINQELKAGHYTLRANTQGNGKNTFAVRLAGVSSAVSADRLSVNVHSQEWMPVLNVTTDGENYALRMYDGDGPEELEARLRDAQGAVYSLPVSGDLSWMDLPLPSRAGTYTIELRQPNVAKQFSNTVSFELNRLGTQTPIVVTEVDQTGELRVGAELILPTGNVPTKLPVLVGNDPVMVDGSYTKEVEAGNYPVTVGEVTGAIVEIDKPAAEVPVDGHDQVNIQVTPEVSIELSVDKPEVCIGDDVTVEATGSTLFSDAIPFDLSLEAEGLDFGDQANRTFEGDISGTAPALLRATATATQAGPLSVKLRSGLWEQEKSVDVNVLPNTTSLKLSRQSFKRVEVGEANAAADDERIRVGDTVEVRFSLTNTANEAIEYNLQDQLGLGLEVLESSQDGSDGSQGPQFSGTLEGGQTKTISYRVKVQRAGSWSLKSTLDSQSCSVPQMEESTLVVLEPPPPPPAPEPEPEPEPAPPPPPQPEPDPEPKPAPAMHRQSVVSLPFEAPASSKKLLVTHQIPAGASYVAGSSRLGGQTLPDPKRGESGTLYWEIEATEDIALRVEKGSSKKSKSEKDENKYYKGTISYDLKHTAALGPLAEPALRAEFVGDRTELLSGQLDEKDAKSAQVTVFSQVQLPENAGPIKLPLADSEIRIRDRVSVTVEAPQGAIPLLTVNGQAVSQDLIGTNTQDPERKVQRLTFVGVPLVVGPNIIRFLDKEITVRRIGKTKKVAVSPVALVADSVSPVRVKLRALDAFGQPTEQSFVTIRSNLEPNVPDANPGEPDYQVRLVDGEGVLELQPQVTPTKLKIEVLRDAQNIDVHTYDVRPDDATVGVGIVSATLGIGFGGESASASLMDNFSWQARAYYEGGIAGGKLYVAADKEGLDVESNPLVRHPVMGDAGKENVPLQGIDPVAAHYDHSLFNASYRRTNVPVDVLPLGESMTAFTVKSKTNPSVSGFVAWVPRDGVKNLELAIEGTRILRVPNLNGATIYEGSESITLATFDSNSGAELKRKPLIRNVDYILDNATGIITLVEALDNLNGRGNTQRVYISYRVDNKLENRQLVYGGQAKLEGRYYSVGVAAISLDEVVTMGAQATYDNGNIKGNVNLRYADGIQAQASVQTRLAKDHNVTASARYEQKSYKGLGKGTDGIGASVDYNGRVADNIRANASAKYTMREEANGTTTQSGSVGAGAEYSLAPFSVGLGAKYDFGAQEGFGVTASVGYQQEPFSVKVTHNQAVSGKAATNTEFGLKYKLNPTTTLGVSDKVTWGNQITHLALLRLDTILGGVNYAVSYELPTADGKGNRARFGARTNFPIGEKLAVGLRGNALYSVDTKKITASGGVDVKFKEERFVATAATDVTYRADKFGVVLRGGVTGSLTDNLTLTGDALVELLDKEGQRFSVGYAYRSGVLNSLGYVRYVNGSLAGVKADGTGGKPELTGGASVEFRQPWFAVRAGADVRSVLNQTDSLTWQAYVGGTVYVTDFVGIGAWGRMISQPANNSTQFGYGLEASLRALPGAWLTAGYNIAGFDGIPTAGTYTKQGLYIRLDLTVDETLNGLVEKQ